jgi:hypothetical protein
LVNIEKASLHTQIPLPSLGGDPVYEADAGETKLSVSNDAIDQTLSDDAELLTILDFGINGVEGEHNNDLRFRKIAPKRFFCNMMNCYNIFYSYSFRLTPFCDKHDEFPYSVTMQLHLFFGAEVNCARQRLRTVGIFRSNSQPKTTGQWLMTNNNQSNQSHRLERILIKGDIKEFEFIIVVVGIIIVHQGAPFTRRVDCFQKSFTTTLRSW